MAVLHLDSPAGTSSLSHGGLFNPGHSFALVPKCKGVVAEQTKTISKVALDRLSALEAEMLKSYQQGEDQKSILLIRRYEEKVQHLLHVSMTSLGRRPFFANLSQRLFSRLQDIDNIRRVVEKKGRLKGQIESLFEQQIQEIDQNTPIEIQSYLNQVSEQLKETMDAKNGAFNAQGAHYLKKVKSLEKFLTESSSVLPSFSLYGEIETKMHQYKKELFSLQNDLIKTMCFLANPNEILAQIQGKIALTIMRVKDNKQKALEQLGESLTDALLDETLEMGQQLKLANEIYLMSLEGYLKIVKATIKEMVQEVAKCLAIGLNSQDLQMEILVKKSASVTDYLDHETKKILEIAQAFQQPIVTKHFGEKNGDPFDTSSAIVDGRISKIAVGLKRSIESIQLFYTNQAERMKPGPIFGSPQASNKEIYLSSLEKVYKVVVGSSPIPGSKTKRKIENLTFHVHNHEGRGFHTYELGGEKNSKHQLEEIFFGNEYYLCGMRGYASSKEVTGISFLFVQDFSKFLKEDLSTRMEKALSIVKEHHCGSLSKLEMEEIEKTFSDQLFVDLDQVPADPYTVLEIEPGSSKEQIKKAYHRLARKYHPDKVEAYKAPLYARRFRDIESAYKSLLKGLDEDLPPQKTDSICVNTPSLM